MGLARTLIGASSPVWYFNFEFYAKKNLSKTAAMNMNRREFLILTTAVAVTGCQSVDDKSGSTTNRIVRVVNAGPLGAYATDGVYSVFRNQGFFIIRQGEKLFALSATCTHKKCRLNAEPNRSFYCPCHGSIFDPSGHVTQGPARRDLPVFTTSVNESGQLLVTVSP
jgi:Rieske Fe-S protein